MIDDLLSLRILMLLESARQRGLLRQGAAAASVPVDIIEAGSAAEACERLAGNDVDVVFVSAGLSAAADRAAVIARARAAERAPFVFAVAAAKGAVVTSGAAAADGTIVLPADVDGTRRMIDRCSNLHELRRVLIVDDSLTMRSIVRKILKASRFPLDPSDAKEATDALSQIAGSPFDMVFLDYHMPGLNGIDALSEIKGRHPDLHVVIMTTAADASLVERVQRAGAAALLKKPFYPADIDAILHRIYGLAELSAS